jgi:hypothetical protein
MRRQEIAERGNQSLERDVFDLDLILLIIEIDGRDLFLGYRGGWRGGGPLPCRSGAARRLLPGRGCPAAWIHRRSRLFFAYRLSRHILRLQAALDEAFLPFGEILTGDFASLPHKTTLWNSVFSLFGTAFVGPEIVRRQRERCKPTRLGSSPHIRIASQSSDENGLIDVHIFTS